MTPLEERLVRRLIEVPGSLSRNRNFAAFEEPALKRARRTARLLGHLIEELEAGALVQDAGRSPDAMVRLRLVRPEQSLVREVRLSPEEYRVLRSLCEIPLPDVDADADAMG